ncbi:MAG TPA: EAL domain-containing protein [Candidatus Dormibacteraeota bacterium]|jgi:diguanylate cyclase (GGDEF)-like protein|nr:EAL domain-containing protein [Candidatus Dormibacteraeota bacterium]
MQQASAGVSIRRGGVPRPALARVLSTGTARVWAVNSILVITALALTLGPLRDARPLHAVPALPWPLLALLAAFAEVCVVHIHYHREAHSFSLREMVLVVALFSVSPVTMVVAQTLGSGVALVSHRRQSPMKLVFNLGLIAAESAIAAMLFRFAVDGHSVAGPAGWIGTLCAVSVVTILSGTAIVITISLAEGRSLMGEWPQMAGFAMAGAIANCSMGLAAVMLYLGDPRSIALLLPPSIVLLGAYRAYTGERIRKERVETLYRSTHELQRAPDLSSAAAVVLSHAAEMTRADHAELVLFALDADSTPLRARLSQGTLEPLSSYPEAAGDALSAATVASAGNLLVPRRGDSPLRPMLQQRGLVDTVATVLTGDSGVFGTLMVGNRLGDVSTFDNSDQQLVQALASHASVTLENRRLEQQLKHQAFHDGLTRLANRALLTNRIEHALNRRNTDESVAILYLDLDDFKLINDGLGHAAGDQLLGAVAERLRACLRPFDTAARLGGDEFAVLIEDSRSPDDAVRVAQRIEEALATPFSLETQEVTIGASIGVVWAGQTHADAEELLRNADIAMYRAKASGGGFELFERSMQVAVEERHGMKADLQRAMEQGGLTPHYQPVVNLTTGKITGVEALLRWEHPERGLLSPAEFVPLAEETGLIVAIDQMVLRVSLAQLREWQETFGDRAPQRVSVNVSSRALRDPEFARRVLVEVEAARLAPSSLVLEITETVLLDDLETAGLRLQRLRDAGVRIAIDDFGTGYSSLGYLRRLPMDVVKIDRTFVAGIDTAVDERSLTLAIVRMLGMLDVEIVAEGIETAQQLAYVQAMGCDGGQGYGLSRPLPAPGIAELLREGGSLIEAMVADTGLLAS